MRFFALIIAIGMSASGCGAIAPIKGSGRQPRTNVVGIHLGGHPLQTVVGAGSVWVLICDAGCSQRTLPQRARLAKGRLVRLSVETGRVLSVTPIADPGAVAVGEGAAWVTHPDKGTVSRIDLDRGRVMATVGLVLPRPIVPGDRAFLPNDVAAGERGVWVSTARGWVARIDPRSDRVVAMIALPAEATGRVVTGASGVWVAEDVLGLFRIDPVTDRVTKTAIAGPAGSRFAVDQAVIGAGAAWAEGSWATTTPAGYVLTDRGGLAELGVGDRRVTAVVPIPPGPSGVTWGDGGIWIASRTRAIVQRLDPRSRRIAQTIRVPDRGMRVTFGAGALWLTSDAGVLTRVYLRSRSTTSSFPPTHLMPPADSIVFDEAASDSLDARIEIAYVPAGGGPVVSLTTASKGGMVAAEPRWSPDGSRIAFVMSPRGYLTRYAGDGDIYVMNADRTDIRRLTDGLDASSPAWSPDGSRIAFVKNQGQELVFMHADGSDQHVIASARGYYQGPAWSPDGRAIAYQSSPNRNIDVTAIYTIKPDGTDERQLTPSASAGCSEIPSGAVARASVPVWLVCFWTCLMAAGHGRWLWSCGEWGTKGGRWVRVVLVIWSPGRGRDRCCRSVGDPVLDGGAERGGRAAAVGRVALWSCSSWWWPRWWGACWCGARQQPVMGTGARPRSVLGWRGSVVTGR